MRDTARTPDRSHDQLIYTVEITLNCVHQKPLKTNFFWADFSVNIIIKDFDDMCQNRCVSVESSKSNRISLSMIVERIAKYLLEEKMGPNWHNRTYP